VDTLEWVDVSTPIGRARDNTLLKKAAAVGDVRSVALALADVLLMVVLLVLILWNNVGVQQDVRIAVATVVGAVLLVTGLLVTGLLRSSGVGQRLRRVILALLAISLEGALAFLGHGIDHDVPAHFTQHGTLILAYMLVGLALLMTALLLAFDPWSASPRVLTRRLVLLSALVSLVAALDPLVGYFDISGPGLCNCPSGINPQHALYAVLGVLPSVTILLLCSDRLTQPPWNRVLQLAPVVLTVVLAALFLPFMLDYRHHHGDEGLLRSLWVMGLAMVFLIAFAAVPRSDPSKLLSPP
jgi:hypothetical protein